MSDKQIPRGLWFHLNGLPESATEESLSAWLADIGMDVPADHIDIRPNRSGALCATICYPRELAITLFKWALQDQKFEGKTVTPSYNLRAGDWW
jgi:hypothetical protein